MNPAAPVVVDASVVVKWYVPEVGTPEAQALRHITPVLAAPDLLGVEVTNAVWKKVLRGELQAVDGQTIIQALAANRQLVFYPSGPLLERAFDTAVSLRHPVYDALYLALAAVMQSYLVTDDQRLVAAVQGTSYASLVQPLRP